MPPLIAIHEQPGGFSDRWIELCEAEGIRYRRVDCRSTGIIEQLDGVDALLWHWLHYIPEDQLIARQVIAALGLQDLRPPTPRKGEEMAV